MLAEITSTALDEPTPRPAAGSAARRKQAEAPKATDTDAVADTMMNGSDGSAGIIDNSQKWLIGCCAATEGAEFRATRGALAGKALSVNGPTRRRPCRARVCAQEFFAHPGISRDRGSANASRRIDVMSQSKEPANSNGFRTFGARSASVWSRMAQKCQKEIFPSRPQKTFSEPP